MKFARTLLKCLLICVVVIFSIIVTSCEKKGSDSGPRKLNDPDIPENEAYVTVSGSDSGTIKPEIDVKVEKVSKEGYKGYEMLIISWNDANGNKLSTRIVSESGDIEPGVYKVVNCWNDSSSQYSCFSVTYEGEVWRNISGEFGTVTITTNNQNRVAGTLNGVTVNNPPPDTNEKLILNGGFNALKGINYGPADSVKNIINLSGIKIHEEEDIIPRNDLQYEVYKDSMKISWRDKHSNHKVLINIFGLEKGETSKISVISPKDYYTQRYSPPFAYMKVTYEGIRYSSVTYSSGVIWLKKNNNNRIFGNMFNINVKGKPEHCFSVTGQIDISK